MRKYECFICGGTFLSEVSDTEAEAQMHRHFGPDATRDQCETVCTPCSEEFLAWARQNGRVLVS